MYNKDKTFKQKEIERIEYIIRKLRRKDFLTLEIYKDNPEEALKWHENELEVWKKT